MSDIRYSIRDVSFVWDENKNSENVKLHGVRFETAALVFFDDLRVEFPDPDVYDEERYLTIGLVHKVLTVVYCDRYNQDTGETDYRIISARVADKLEREMYNNIIRGRGKGI